MEPLRFSENMAMIILLLVIISVYVFEISLFSRYLVAKIFRTKTSRLLSKPAIALHVLAGIGVLCFAYSYFIEPFWIEVTRIEIRTPKLKKSGFRIVHISDLHCEQPARNEPRLAEIINPLEPDIIVFTGDTLNSKAGLPILHETLRGLKAKSGKFAVRGNFDVWYWYNLDLFGDTGFRLLDEQSVSLTINNESVYISGIGSGHYEDATAVLGNVPSDAYSVFLYHYPDLIENLDGLNVDLYLAGHTHGGQIALPLYGALITFTRHGKKYESGKYEVGKTILYINRGIGMEGGNVPRVRFWAWPEISVFDIKPYE